MPRTQSPVVKLKTAHQIAFTAAEDRVAFFGDRYVSVQSVPSFNPIFAVRSLAHPSDVDFSPDGARLMVKGTSGHTMVLDAQTGRVLSDFRNQKEGEGCALFTSCSRYVVSVSWNGLLTVRDSSTAEMVFSQLYDSGMLNKLTAPRDRRFFVYSIGSRASSDSEAPPPETVVLRPWPIRAGDCRELPQRWSFIIALEVSPSGRLLAVVYGAPPETLEIYDIEQSRVIASRAVEFGGTGCSIGWSPDEKLLAMNGDHRCVVVETAKLVVTHDFPLQYCCYVGFSPSSRFLSLGSWKESFIVPLDHLATFAEGANERRVCDQES